MDKKFKINKRKSIGKQINKAADTIAAKEPAGIRNLRRFAEKHKLMMLVTFVVFVAVIVSSIFIYNYNTAYEYSYNGKTLGVVKDKEDVLKITTLVQTALTEDRDVQVVIDPEQDIKFERTSIFGSSILYTAFTKKFRSSFSREGMTTAFAVTVCSPVWENSTTTVYPSGYSSSRALFWNPSGMI
jgi:hypothetical protein